MDRSDIERVLRGNIDKTVSVTFEDGIVLKVIPLTVDDEGFVYDLQENGATVQYWTRFEDIVAVYAENPATRI